MEGILYMRSLDVARINALLLHTLLLYHMGVHPLSPPFPLGNLLIECDTIISKQETLFSLFLITLLTITHVTYHKIK